jgi:glutamate-1-semialdehyde 2,1-aminomutase
MLAPLIRDSSIDVSGIGGTLTGNALATAAVRATLSSTLRADDFERMIPLATSWSKDVQETVDKYELPWCVQQLGARAEYWFCPPPRSGKEAALAVDDELDAFLHLYALNRGVLLTPFHNMALMSPLHTKADVQAHSEVFRGAVQELLDV